MGSAFDTDDLFKERAVTPLGLPEDSLNSDTDSTGGEEHHGVVYAYDAAAESKKQWLNKAMAHRPQAVPST